MELIKKLIELAYYYKTDESAGKPYWEDTKLVGLIVGMIATETAKFLSVSIDADLQLKIVAVFVGLGALADKRTGLAKHPADQVKEAAKAVQEHNLSNLS